MTQEGGVLPRSQQRKARDARNDGHGSFCTRFGMDHDNDSNDAFSHSACHLTGLGQRGLFSCVAECFERRGVTRSRSVEGGPHFLKTGGGLGVEAAVTAVRSKAALKRDQLCGLRGRPRAIADGAQILEYAAAVDFARRRRRACRRPDPDPGASEPRPIEQFPGIALAVRRNVRMPDDPVRRNRMTRDHLSTQPLHGRHLRFREWSISPFVTWIDDLDPDRHRVEIAFALPTRATRVKGAAALRNETPNSTVFLDDVVSTDPCDRIAQPLQRSLGTRHAGIVEHQHVDAGGITPTVVIGRRPILDLKRRHSGPLRPYDLFVGGVNTRHAGSCQRDTFGWQPLRDHEVGMILAHQPVIRFTDRAGRGAG
jgi:hypothetical protein